MIPLRWSAATLAAAVLFLARSGAAAPSPSTTASHPATAAAARPRARKPATAPGAATTPVARPDTSSGAGGEKAEVLRGGADGTVFRTLTVEGEDRVHVEFERPALELDLDPEHAPGLELGSARDVLERGGPEPMTPLLAMSAHEASPYLGRPWLSDLASGAVARFRPAVTDVERWKLTVANAKGETVTSFSGTGTPPREIGWDGRSANGSPVVPGLTYSYVFEAWDRAGNRRSFVGNGFQVSAYRVASPTGQTFVFSGREALAGARAAAGPSPVLLETASWLNQSRAARHIQVTATARSFEQASTLSEAVAHALATCVLGDPARIQATSLVEADAPEAGTVKVAAIP